MIPVILRRALAGAFVAGLLLSPLAWGADGKEEAAPAMKAPDFTAKDLEGKTVRLAELLAEGPVLLDFWTSWCKPCQIELPELNRIHKTYRDRGFKVIAIAQDDPKTIQKVKPIVKQMGLEVIVLIDPKKEVGNAYKVRNYPTSFLISKDGNIAHFAQGYMRGDEKRLEELVAGMVEGPVEETEPGKTE